MQRLKRLIAPALVSLVTLTSAPALAVPALPGAVKAPDRVAEPAQYRPDHGRHHRRWDRRRGWDRRDGWDRRHHPRGRYYDRRHYRGSSGAGLAAGLAAGALAAGAAAAAQSGQADGVAYCQRRFKSYDPASGTYLGYDGRRHACP